MNKKRLLKLADELERLAEQKKRPRFNLALWGTQRKEQRGKKPSALTCATAACAVGTAMLLPAFRRQGLGCTVINENQMVPTYRRGENWEAVDKFFFDIPNPCDDRPSEEATFLFSYDSYPKRHWTGRAGMRAVAKRIRDFVAGKVSVPEYGCGI